MKRFLPAVLAVLLLLAMLTGCAQPGGPDVEPEAPVTGGVTDTSDPNAPKTIESTEITKFYCYFSTLTLAEPGALGNRAFTMTAEADGDTGTQTISFRIEAPLASMSSRVSCFARLTMP